MLRAGAAPWRARRRDGGQARVRLPPRSWRCHLVVMSNTGAAAGVTVGRAAGGTGGDADPWSCNEPLDGFTATLKDSTRDDAPGQVPADHGLQAGVEPARSHPVELAEYLSALRKCKNSSVRAMMRVWLENGGPLTTPVSQEIDQWDTFLGK
jgi:hypothetical protein